MHACSCIMCLGTALKMAHSFEEQARTTLSAGTFKPGYFGHVQGACALTESQAKSATHSAGVYCVSLLGSSLEGIF